MNEYEDIINKRNIGVLLHFTPTQNIEYIKKHGLLTPKEIHRRQLPVTRNDFRRLDRKDGICLSITFYNHYVLNSFKEKNNDEFSIIGIKPEIILTKECFFYDTNAAAGKFETISKEYLKSVHAFEGMFASKVDTKHGQFYRRSSLNSNETTDKQAEIIVNENIETEYIIFK